MAHIRIRGPHRIFNPFWCRFQCFFGAGFRSDSGAHFGNLFGSKNRLSGAIRCEIRSQVRYCKRKDFGPEVPQPVGCILQD